MKWNLEYKKDNGFAKEIETYDDVLILGSYCGNSGLVGLVPERKWGKDTGIRRFSYNGIVNMTLAR